MDSQNQQGDASLLETVMALQDLAHLSYREACASTEGSPSTAKALLTRIMLLCKATRGAICLAESSSAESGSLSSSTEPSGRIFRHLALQNVDKEEIQKQLTLFSSESLWTSPPSHNPSWLRWRLPVMLSFPFQENTHEKMQGQADHLSSLSVLLLFGWDNQDDMERATALRNGPRALLHIEPAIKAVIVQVLSSEYIYELEARTDQKSPYDMELLKAELLATVSHELRSPLASIKGYAATLLRHERRISREERREFLLAIHEATDRLSAIINTLLEMSELETETIVLERMPVDIVRLVREAFFVAEQRLKATEGSVYDLSPAHPLPTFALHIEDHHEVAAHDEYLMIEADQSRLREVLDHLLKNAVIHGAEGGVIDVTIRPILSTDVLTSFPPVSQEAAKNITRLQQRAHQVIVITVHDNGSGIPATHLTRIFEPFYRVDTRLIRERSGLGLGLAICRRIIELHDGLLWAESEVEKGSTFYICLPQGDILDIGYNLSHRQS